MEENTNRIELIPEKEMLPESQRALVLSIVGNSLSLVFMIPVLGILACIAGLVLSIMGMRKGREGMELWKTDKKKYHGGSYAKTIVAFVLGIVGIVQAGILFIYGIFFTLMIFSSGFRHF